MESFALLQEHLAMCGIEITEKSSENQPFNAKNLTVCFVLCVDVGLNVMLLNEANTFDEYTNILLIAGSVSTCGIFYVIIIWKTVKLFEFINALADTVKSSGYKNI